MFDDARKKKLMDLFAEGVEFAPSERAAFVEHAAADDPELQEELRSLLEIRAGELDGFLEAPLAASPSAAPVTPPTIPGYTDLVPIGEGGMGTVYRAQQVAPVRRVVAIKAIRPGMDSRQVLARFDAERQALARMAHPYIAVVHDAGTDDRGRPYLAMEHVDGLPITDYCRRHDLDLEGLLELFAKVCDAVDHAHRRGVLHRDLKPTNVLVVHTDDGPLPKVIDFGLAKALEGSLGDESVHTLQGTLLGTPEYMSPEQLEGDARVIDTRADVYSLGAMLYELLCGERPFDSQRLRAAGISALARIVREEIPPRPSTRLGQRTDATAAKLGTLHWSRRLHSDLDWVAMKALEKDPERRYATPRALAEDIRRFLRHQPVEAGPPSGFYRVRKFARRYRIQLAAIGAVIAVLIIGLIGTLWFLLESQDNEARARKSAREAEGTRLAATAALVSENDANLALLLAVEASELSDDFSVHETILGALPRQNLIGRFLQPDYETTTAIFLGDGRLLACGMDPVFWLIDVDSGKLLHRFVGHTDRVNAVAPAPSGKQLASASGDGTVRIWDLDSGICQRVIELHTGVTKVEWTADGSTIGALGADGVVRLFATADGAMLGRFGEKIRDFDLTADGTRVATFDAAGSTMLWSAGGERSVTIPLDPLRDDRGRVIPDEWVAGSVTFAAGGSRLLVTVERPLQPTRMLLYSAAGDRILALDDCRAVRTDKDRLRLSRPDRVTAVSLATGEIVEEAGIESEFGLKELLSISPDGRHAIGSDNRRDLCLVDLVQRRVTTTLAGENDKNRRNRAVAWHPDGERFVITGRELRMWRIEPEYAPFHLPVEARNVRPVSLAAAGEALVLLQHVAAGGPRWSLWSIDRRCKLRDLPLTGLDHLQLARDGTVLQGLRPLPQAPGQRREAELLTFDLEGTILATVTVPYRDSRNCLRPAGDLYVYVEVADTARTAHFFEARTGAPRGSVVYDPAWHVWGMGRDARYFGAQFGSRTRSDVFDLRTGALVASVRGPAGAGHYGLAIDDLRQRMVLTLGDLRALCYDLRDPDAGPTGEYTRLVRGDSYASGILPDGSLAWVLCSNEVHLFDAVTGRPFAALGLQSDAQLAAARADSSELVTIDQDGTCNRWPLDTGAAARRMARGALTLRQRDLFRIGTPEERVAHEEERLAASPTPRNLAMLGESRLGRGDLDGAIEAYLRCTRQGPLAPMDRRRYVRLLELLARRHTARGRSEQDRAADVAMATDALREAIRCGASRAELEALPDASPLLEHPELRRLLPH